jgi:hypothetical protein
MLYISHVELSTIIKQLVIITESLNNANLIFVYNLLLVMLKY